MKWLQLAKLVTSDQVYLDTEFCTSVLNILHWTLQELMSVPKIVEDLATLYLEPIFLLCCITSLNY